MKTTIQEITISKSQRRDEIATFREQAARIAALEAAVARKDAALYEAETYLMIAVPKRQDMPDAMHALAAVRAAITREAGHD